MSITPNNLLTTGIATANIRSDLQDLTASTYRWQDSDIARALDRTVAEYSRIAPLLQATQVATGAYRRVYSNPAPVGYWTDRIEYPLGYRPKRYRAFTERYSPQLIVPSIANTTITTIHSNSGNLGQGTYSYLLAFTVPGTTGALSGELYPFDAATNGSLCYTAAYTTTPSNSVTLSSIPIPPKDPNSAATSYYGRRIYRTKLGNTTFQYLADLPDITTTTYLDNTADTALGATAGGVNTTGGIRQVEIDLPDSYLPADTTGTIEITYTSKHELDSAGTTIPERHWDAIYAGAEFSLLLAYLTTTNDNFDYVDGQFRDRVDDSKAPTAWLKQANLIATRWETRKAEIREEFNALSPTHITAWGDKPYYWDRL